MPGVGHRESQRWYPPASLVSDKHCRQASRFVFNYKSALQAMALKTIISTFHRKTGCFCLLLLSSTLDAGVSMLSPFVPFNHFLSLLQLRGSLDTSPFGLQSWVLWCHLSGKGLKIWVARYRVQSRCSSENNGWLCVPFELWIAMPRVGFMARFLSQPFFFFYQCLCVSFLILLMCKSCSVSFLTSFRGNCSRYTGSMSVGRG